MTQGQSLGVDNDIEGKISLSQTTWIAAFPVVKYKYVNTRRIPVTRIKQT